MRFTGIMWTPTVLVAMDTSRESMWTIHSVRSRIYSRKKVQPKHYTTDVGHMITSDSI